MTRMTREKRERKAATDHQRSVDDGTPMLIKDQKENWSECTLEDGTKIRIRPVITEVRKLKHVGADGKHAYGIKSALITDVQHVERPKKGG